MTFPNYKRSVRFLFVLLPFIVMFAIAYYNSAKSSVKPYQVFRDKYRNQLMQAGHQPQVHEGRVVLPKNDKVFIDDICLVFKGVSRGMVHLEIYLLKLDPETPYPLEYTMASLKEGVWVENVMYRLVSAKENVLRLAAGNSE